MFGGDRFGPDQDYAATYRSLGGSRLAPEVVQAAIPACYERELKLLEDVIARHERGQVPDSYAIALRSLARSHPLGLVANILSRKDLWLEEFRRAGVLDRFVVTVFSSDTSSIKPSRKLFDQAVSALPVPRSEIVFVGDNLRCDIGGAAGAGLATVWLDPAGAGRRDGDPQPDFVVRDLLELVRP